MNAANIIDLDHLEKYVSGDLSLRGEILDIFSEQLGHLLDQFDVFQADEDWKNTAHALKGASRGVGAWTLGDLCEQAEKLVGATPAKQESRATLLVSLRFTARGTLEESRRIAAQAA